MNPVEAVLSGMAARRRMQREDEDAEDRKRKRGEEAEDRTFTMSERARGVKLRTDLGAAAAPVAVEQREQAGPVDAASPVPAAAQPMAPVPTVQGRGFETTEAATEAAAGMNTPQAVAGRQAQVLSAAGEAAGAQQIRTGAMQEQSARLKLNGDERAELDARFNADLQSRVNSWESFDQFTSESAGDGMGGKLKLQTTVSPDGATRIVNVVAPDGTLKPTGQSFPNTADGLMLATNELAKMSPEKKLAHLYQKEQARRQAAAQASTEKYQAGMLQATQDRTASQIENAGLRTQLAQQRAGGAAGAGGAAPGAGMTLADLKDGHKGIASTLNADWKAQIEATTDPAQLKAIKVARENEIATVQRLYTGAMSAGFGLTPEQAIVAFRSGEVRSGTVDAPGGGKMKVQGVVYGGKFIPLAENPGTLPPADAQPAATVAPQPGAKPVAAPMPPMAAIPVDPNGPQAPPVAPEQPGMVAAAAAAVGKTAKKAARYADGREWKNLAAGR